MDRPGLPKGQQLVAPFCAISPNALICQEGSLGDLVWASCSPSLPPAPGAKLRLPPSTLSAKGPRQDDSHPCMWVLARLIPGLGSRERVVRWALLPSGRPPPRTTPAEKVQGWSSHQWLPMAPAGQPASPGQCLPLPPFPAEASGRLDGMVGPWHHSVSSFLICDYRPPRGGEVKWRGP